MLLLYALARPIASSLSAASTNNSTSFDPITGECIDINGCRTTTGIIWSCLSVIFICTWVAIHPNIPLVEKFDFMEDEWSGRRWDPAVAIYQNVELMVIALLAPEIMILWAMRQREQAKKIRDKFRDKYGWGMSHGFFVIMGGFALYNGDKFCGYLWDRDRGYQYGLLPYEGHAEKLWGDVKRYRGRCGRCERCEKCERCRDPIGNIQEGQSHEDEKASELPIPEEKTPLTTSPEPTAPSTAPQKEPSTPIPETILEFLVAKGYITITEDEIKDRSHADVITKSIAIIQTIWFIMQVIARAVEGLAITELEIITVGFAILNFGTYFLWWNKPLRVRHPVRVYWKQTEKSAGGDTDGEKEGFWGTCREGPGAIMDYIYANYIFDKRPHNTFIRVLLLPLWIPYHILVVCERILRDTDNRDLAIPISSRLGNDPPYLYIAVYGIAALFGAIHCIPWVFQFPTHTEQLLWRISAVAVAAAPVAMGLLHGYVKKLEDSAPTWVTNMVIIIMLILSLAYTVFRTTLIVIAFTSIRDLSPGAYQTVQWTTFIPHIS
ncbi:hypothetical protein VNI00_016931 [Paramarasmius palmivorus]|uniref:Uncharacterized protein n=1 Tax=Paramarasmius palmivorus TaxID=297713 RepID=A0AAW0B9C6_9AGAR